MGRTLRSGRLKTPTTPGKRKKKVESSTSDENTDSSGANVKIAHVGKVSTRKIKKVLRDNTNDRPTSILAVSSPPKKMCLRGKKLSFELKKQSENKCESTFVSTKPTTKDIEKTPKPKTSLKHQPLIPKEGAEEINPKTMQPISVKSFYGCAATEEKKLMETSLQKLITSSEESAESEPRQMRRGRSNAINKRAQLKKKNPETSSSEEMSTIKPSPIPRSTRKISSNKRITTSVKFSTIHADKTTSNTSKNSTRKTSTQKALLFPNRSFEEKNKECVYKNKGALMLSPKTEKERLALYDFEFDENEEAPKKKRQRKPRQPRNKVHRIKPKINMKHLNSEELKSEVLPTEVQTVKSLEIVKIKKHNNVALPTLLESSTAQANPASQLLVNLITPATYENSQSVKSIQTLEIQNKPQPINAHSPKVCVQLRSTTQSTKDSVPRQVAVNDTQQTTPIQIKEKLSNPVGGSPPQRSPKLPKEIDDFDFDLFGLPGSLPPPSPVTPYRFEPTEIFQARARSLNNSLNSLTSSPKTPVLAMKKSTNTPTLLKTPVNLPRSSPRKHSRPPSIEALQSTPAKILKKTTLRSNTPLQEVTLATPPSSDGSSNFDSPVINSTPAQAKLKQTSIKTFFRGSDEPEEKVDDEGLFATGSKSAVQLPISPVKPALSPRNMFYHEVSRRPGTFSSTPMRPLISKTGKALSPVNDSPQALPTRLSVGTLQTVLKKNMQEMPISTLKPNSKLGLFSETDVTEVPKSPKRNFKMPPRKSYERRARKKVGFMDIEEEDDDADSEHEKEEEEVLPSGAKPKRDHHAKKNGMNEKEFEAWASRFSALLDDVENFELEVE